MVGVDNLNDAYDVRMKEHRLERLRRTPGVEFRRIDISGKNDVENLAGEGFAAIIHLAARAGVRASVENPGLFYETNVMGTAAGLREERGRKAFNNVDQVPFGWYIALSSMRGLMAHTN